MSRPRVHRRLVVAGCIWFWFSSLRLVTADISLAREEDAATTSNGNKEDDSHTHNDRRLRKNKRYHRQQAATRRASLLEETLSSSPPAAPSLVKGRPKLAQQSSLPRGALNAATAERILREQIPSYYYVPKYGRRWYEGLLMSITASSTSPETLAHFAPKRCKTSRNSKSKGLMRKNKALMDNKSRMNNNYPLKSRSRSKGTSKSKSKGRSKGKRKMMMMGKSKSDYYFCPEEAGDEGEDEKEEVDLEDLFGPLGMVTCSSVIRTFQSTVSCNLNGQPQFPTGAEQAALETSFQDTYNTLSFGNCDGYFRQLDGVSLTVGTSPLNNDQATNDGQADEERTRRLQFGTMTTTTTTGSNNFGSRPSSSSSSSTVASGSDSFMVTGTCRNCPVTSVGSFLLFDDVFRRKRRGLQESNAEGGGAVIPIMNENGQDAGMDVCECPLSALSGTNGTLLPPNAPTADEFLRAFNLDIERLVNEGVLFNVDSINSLEEEAPTLDGDIEVPCDPILTEFTSYVYVDIVRSGEEPLDIFALADDLVLLERAFEQAYNEIVLAQCDRYFRETKLDGTEAFLTFADDFLSVDALYFQVNATCRGCDPTEDGFFSLFDILPPPPPPPPPANGQRHLSHGKNSNHHHRHHHYSKSSSFNENEPKSFIRHMQAINDDENFCTCPALTSIYRLAPTLPEFQEGWNGKISELVEAGQTVTDITAIRILGEEPRPLPGEPTNGEAGTDERDAPMTQEPTGGEAGTDEMEVLMTQEPTNGETGAVEVEIACSPNIEEFSVNLKFTMNGVAIGPAYPIIASDKEIIVLTFAPVYNELTYANCDGFFRMVEAASLKDIPAGQTLVFQVAATCRNCNVDADGFFSLFDNEARERQLQASSYSFAKINRSKNEFSENEHNIPAEGSLLRGLQAVDDICMCPTMTTNNLQQPLPMAPALEAFQDAFNARLSELTDMGQLSAPFLFDFWAEASNQE
jgi:hypothetical protein